MKIPPGYHLEAQADGVGHLVKNRGRLPPRLCDGHRRSLQWSGYKVRVACPGCQRKAEELMAKG